MQAEGDLQELRRESLKIIKFEQYKNEGDPRYMKYQGHTITKRSDSRWETKCYVNGKRISIYGKTQKACYDKLKRTLSEQGQEKRKIPVYNFHDWLDYWLNTYKSERRSSDNDKTIKSIKKHSKNIKISDITVNFIQELINTIHTSRGRVSVYHVLNMALRTAYDNELIKSNPVDKISKPRHIKTPGKALTFEDENILIEKLKKSELKNVILFYLYSGCRRSEALRIQVSDINLEKKLIHIPGTKTVGSDRYIPIFPKLLNCIPKKLTETGYIFNYKADYITHEFHKIMPDYAIKDLRTTFATRMHEKGIPSKYIQKWLGHTSMLTTEKSYIKADNDIFELELLKKLTTE